MPKNDLLLVDRILDEYCTNQSPNQERGKLFELFALENLLKDYDLSTDEMELGIVDGRDDAGIDAWYLFLDNTLITDPSDFSGYRVSTPHIKTLIFTAKHHNTFKQATINNLCVSIDELFDLGKEDNELISHFNESVIDSRNLLKQLLLKTAGLRATLEFKFYYVSRGDSSEVGSNIKARSDLLIKNTYDLFSNCIASFDYIGASELLVLYRKTKDFSASIKFEENVISRGKSNYLILARLYNFYQFITDDSGNLKRYLFESNVRDYMGKNPVNEAIEITLNRKMSSQNQDFWWLNNGVTILATMAKSIGKEIFLENVQIVNGLQTTETVYNYAATNQIVEEDDRCVLIKIIVTEDKVLSDQIILATNSQTKVDLASLRSTDKIQRDIEEILQDANWFYDRRKNYYKNHGKPVSQIISMKFMVSCLLALCLKQADQCNRSRPKFMCSDSLYKNLFKEEYNLEVFLAVIEIAKKVENLMLAKQYSVTSYNFYNYTNLYRFMYSLVYVAKKLKTKNYHPNELLSIYKNEVDEKILDEVHQHILAKRDEFEKNHVKAKRLHRSDQFNEKILDGV
jgi:AIPR protein